MKAVGIIAEYDPFHSGHAWQIEQAKRLGAEVVAVCMSGDLVQRGTAALLPPWVRAKAAILSGADLVVELPNPWACLSAEGFAAAGVHLLSALPLDTLVFGAEYPDTDLLFETADLLLSEPFRQMLAEKLTEGMSFAVARAAAAQQLLPGSGAILERPNNNLGVEYCKAIRCQNSTLRPYSIRRQGADHGQSGPGQEGFASASHLRECWAQDGPEGLKGYVPDPARQLYQEQFGQAIDRRSWEIALLSRLRGLTRNQIAQTRGTGEGLEYLLVKSLKTACTLEQLYNQMKSKRYAHARLRRYVLDAALGYTENLPILPPYLHLLAATPAGLALLKKAKLPADTSLARLAKQGLECQTAIEAHTAGADLAALCRTIPQSMGQSYTRPPFIYTK